MRVLNRIAVPSWLLTKKKPSLLAVAGVIVLVILLAALISPTQRAISSKRREWKEKEKKLVEARERQSASYRIDKAGIEAEAQNLRRRLPAKSQMPAILDELARRGKEMSIEFISIKPREEKTKRSSSEADGIRYSTIPIDIDMRATFKNLGRYLDAIDNMESGFATVDNVQISKDDRLFPKLNIKMTVSTYTIEDESGQK